MLYTFPSFRLSDKTLNFELLNFLEWIFLNLSSVEVGLSA